VDDLNALIYDQSKHVKLKYNVDEAVKEHILEPITPSPRERQGHTFKEEAEAYAELVKEIVCGLIAE